MPNLTEGQERRLLLVVDEAEAICELVSEVLSLHGYTVLTATTGKEAVEQFRQHADQIQAVLLDLVMPGMPGAAVLREIHRLRPAVPVILLTGVAEQKALETVAGLPVAGYILKPFLREPLLAKVREVLGD